MQQFPPDFRRDRMVSVDREKLEQRLFLLAAQIALVALDEREQGLVPEDGQLPRVHFEADEMSHGCVDDPVRQGVLLVEQDAQEDRVRSAVAHFRYLQEGGC